MSRPRVLITGGLGRLGRVAVDEFLRHGYALVLLDQAATRESMPDRVRLVTGDVGDVGTVTQALSGCDAVVHLAAIPAPGGFPDDVVFGHNTRATFAVLQAAALLGIDRAVIASSGSAYGTAWSPTPTYARYVPVDEAHPLLPQDPYGLSKEVDERTAEMFARRTGMSIAALRFHWILRREEQLTTIAERRGRPDLDADKRNLWGYVDIRDAARACRLALEVAAERPYGFQAMNIAAADTLAEQPIERLLAEQLPDVEIRTPLQGSAGAFAVRRAQELLGWEPEYSWRSIY